MAEGRERGNRERGERGEREGIERGEREGKIVGIRPSVGTVSGGLGKKDVAGINFEGKVTRAHCPATIASPARLQEQTWRLRFTLPPLLAGCVSFF